MVLQYRRNVGFRRSGPCAHFLFKGGRKMARAQDKLTELVGSAVQALGYELVGVEHLSQGRHSVVRVFIDSEKGITLDDCEQASHQISGVLDVEDPIKGQYNLEVSSPGLDRPLFTLEHYARFAGREVNLRLRRMIDGRRKFKAVIERVEGEQVVIRPSDEEQELSVPFSDIEKANLIPEL